MKEDGSDECISKREDYTKRNLVRATTKSRAGHRQSLMDVSVEWAMT